MFLLLGCVVGVASAAEIKIGTPITKDITGASFDIVYTNVTPVAAGGSVLIKATLKSDVDLPVSSVSATVTGNENGNFNLTMSGTGASSTITIVGDGSNSASSVTTLKAGKTYSLEAQITPNTTLAGGKPTVTLTVTGTISFNANVSVTPTNTGATSFDVTFDGDTYKYAVDQPPVDAVEDVSAATEDAKGEVPIGNTGVSVVKDATKATEIKQKTEAKFGSDVVIKDASSATKVEVTRVEDSTQIAGIAAENSQTTDTPIAAVEISVEGLSTLTGDEYYAFVITAPAGTGTFFHKKTSGTWVSEKFVDNGDGNYTVFIQSFSPIVAYAAAVAPVVDNGGADNGLELLAAAKATPTANVTATPTVEVTVAPTTTVTGNATAVPTDVPSTPTASVTGGQGTSQPTATQAPAPILGILAGLGAAALILRRN